jgi:hypothetical protein
MNITHYSNLCSRLQKADESYIEGRLLWLNQFVNGASNLLWLASEQLLKLLLLQKNITVLSENSSNTKQLFEKLDNEGRKIGHNLTNIINLTKTEYPELDLTPFEPALKKIQEYFYRRYIVFDGGSISLNLLDQIDNFYFTVRAMIHPEVGLGVIDEIFIQQKNSFRHPIPAFKYAYMYNNHFRSRPHTPVSYRAPDNRIYFENGQ